MAPGRLVEESFRILGEQRHGEKCFWQNEEEKVRITEGKKVNLTLNTLKERHMYYF